MKDEEFMEVVPFRKGLKVTDPVDGTDVPDEGKKVPVNSFWLRRLKDKDVKLKSGVEEPAIMKADDATDADASTKRR
jgi:hypothetical protein